MKKVLVGLSGGVDSAAVARLLQNEGYQVWGTYLAFCPDSDPERARLVAERLGIPFTVVNRKRSFENQVIRPFVETYRQGRTPNPCVECNRKMKIASLIREADRLGIELVATGHYARVEQTPSGRFALKKGRDQGKDQSYFLWKLTQKQLSRLMFPLEGLEKKEVRALASDLVLPREKESMEVCFIPKGETAEFVKACGGEMPEGEFVDREGRVLGRHHGIHRYTVGQRRGLGISSEERLFVGKILPRENKILLVKKEELLTEEFFVSDLRFVSVKKSEVPKEGIALKGRHRGVCIPCEVTFCKTGARVKTRVPTPVFSLGQSACFYLGDTLLFGGIFASEEKKSICAKGRK